MAFKFFNVRKFIERFYGTQAPESKVLNFFPYFFWKPGKVFYKSPVCNYLQINPLF